MSAPYEGYPEREQASCPDCGGHPDDCSCAFADEDLLENGPPDLLFCESCQRNTTHMPYCDEHGANRCIACLTCRRVARFY